MPQDTVLQFQSLGAFRKRHKPDFNLPQLCRLSSAEKVGRFLFVVETAEILNTFLIV